MKRMSVLLALGLLSGCAAAEMQMPAALAAGGERIVFENMSGWNKGRFDAGSYSGEYTRTLDRASFGHLTETDGRASFAIAGPGISSTIGLAGEVVRFRSVHHIVGGKLPTADPMGYVFEQDGEAIGALELNGKPVLTLSPDTDLDRRRAVMVAAVALATFWDPAVVES